MSEGQGDAPGDVRSFLPRPGEPVEAYAERLRKLHRDLTLVLQTVERGLAAAGSEDPRGVRVPEAPAPPVSPPAAQAPEPARAREPAPAPGVRGSTPRVEVMPAPDEEERGAYGSRAADDPVGAVPAEPAEPAEPFPAARVDPTARGQRFARRPSAVVDMESEPEWVEREPVAESFTAATFGPLQPPRGGASPVLVAALAAGWLTVLALVLALLFG